MGLDTFIDKIRINKLAEGIATMGMLILAGKTSIVFAKQEIDYFDGFVIFIGLLNLGISIYHARKQNHSYEKLVDNIERHGYVEEFCSMYMDRPCGRSVVKTALRRTGNIDKYKELKTNYPLVSIF